MLFNRTWVVVDQWHEGNVALPEFGRLACHGNGMTPSQRMTAGPRFRAGVIQPSHLATLGTSNFFSKNNITRTLGNNKVGQVSPSRQCPSLLDLGERPAGRYRLGLEF